MPISELPATANTASKDTNAASTLNQKNFVPKIRNRDERIYEFVKQYVRGFEKDILNVRDLGGTWLLSLPSAGEYSQAFQDLYEQTGYLFREAPGTTVIIGQYKNLVTKDINKVIDILYESMYLGELESGPIVKSCIDNIYDYIVNCLKDIEKIRKIIADVSESNFIKIWTVFDKENKDAANLVYQREMKIIKYISKYKYDIDFHVITMDVVNDIIDEGSKIIYDVDKYRPYEYTATFL